MSTPREYSTPLVHVYGDVAVLTRTAKAINSCRDAFNASPGAISTATHRCPDDFTEEAFGSH
jgi:hypothetical protein